MGWHWDRTLYAGSAEHYILGRAPYPAELATTVAAAVGLRGDERLLDVGCGPGSLTLLLAPYVGSAVGLDPDPGMLAAAAGLARRRGVTNTGWTRMRAEDLPAGLGSFDLVTFAQSFHWMERDRVAAAVRSMLSEEGSLVHVHASTDRGEPVDGATAPPWPEVESLVARWLGSDRRAGRGLRPAGPGGDEDAVYHRAGFVHDRRIELPGTLVRRDADQVVAALHSLSWAAPHLFGNRLAAFDAELRGLLGVGPFTEQLPPIGVDVYR